MIDYNIHCFLYDITKGHFKSKILCKHGKHNYQLHYGFECVPEIYEEYDPSATYSTKKIVMYNKNYYTYYKCYCCGKIINEKEV